MDNERGTRDKAPIPKFPHLGGDTDDFNFQEASKEKFQNLNLI